MRCERCPHRGTVLAALITAAACTGLQRSDSGEAGVRAVVDAAVAPVMEAYRIPGMAVGVISGGAELRVRLRRGLHANAPAGHARYALRGRFDQQDVYRDPRVLRADHRPSLALRRNGSVSAAGRGNAFRLRNPCSNWARTRRADPQQVPDGICGLSTVLLNVSAAVAASAPSGYVQILLAT